MSKFNYYLQVTLMIIAALLALLYLFSNDYFVLFACWQYLVGLIQVITTIIFLFIRNVRIKSILHLVLSGVLILLIIFFGEKLWIMVFTLPWLLAINFCRISYRLYLKNLTS